MEGKDISHVKFSVTIPAYKRAYLAEAIESCLAQTYEDFELIIVNDASPEDLEGVVRQYNDPRIRYYRNEKNCGAVDVVDNWNICLGYATGDYLICMGDDDKLLPCCLQEYVNLMARYPGLDLYHGQTERIDDKSEFSDVCAARPPHEGVYSMIWHRWNHRMQYIGDFLFEVASLRERGGFKKFPLAWGSDDISAIMAASVKGVANTGRVVFQYRVNPYTISSTGNEEIKMRALRESEEWYVDFFGTCKPEGEQERKYREACVRMMPTYFLKRKMYTISADMVHNGMFSRCLYWMWNRKKYQVEKKAMAGAFVYAVKEKFVK